MTLNLDVATAQQALDALITGDHQAAAAQFTEDVEFTGAGGCLGGRTSGLPAVLDRFALLCQLTRGTFGTEVAGVYGQTQGSLVVITRHWASIDGEQIHGTQALLITADNGRICRVNTLSRPGPPSGIWD